MPSLFKRAGGAPEAVRHVPVSTVAVRPSADEGDLATIVEPLVAREIEARWQAALSELKAMDEAGRRALVIEREAALVAAQTAGYAQGLSQARADMQASMGEVRRAYHQLESDRLAFMEECKRDVAALVIKIAEVILRAELSMNPNAMMTLFAKAYDELVAQRKVLLFVHPEQLEHVVSRSHLLPIPADGPLLVRADATLDKHSFRLEDDLGSVRYDLPGVLRQLETEVSCGAV